MFISAAPVGVCATACAHTLKDILNPTIRDFYTSGKYKLVIFHFSFLVSEEITNHFLAGNLIKAFMKLVVLILGYQMCSSQMFRSGSTVICILDSYAWGVISKSTKYAILFIYECRKPKQF